jgi:hypothetical protein
LAPSRSAVRLPSIHSSSTSVSGALGGDRLRQSSDCSSYRTRRPPWWLLLTHVTASGAKTGWLGLRCLALLLIFHAASLQTHGRAVAETSRFGNHEFSGTVIKRVNGKSSRAQVFAKGDRLRFEYTYALRTDYGYAAVEIIRLDQSEAWYLLPQRKEVLVAPLDPADALALTAEFPGEGRRLLIGEATAAGRTADLYDVESDHDGRTERWYRWVDRETGITLQLESRDRDWSFRYERIRWSSQPDEYFVHPRGYQTRRVGAIARQER